MPASSAVDNDELLLELLLELQLLELYPIPDELVPVISDSA
jgi:hypothetical protein